MAATVPRGKAISATATERRKTPLYTHTTQHRCYHLDEAALAQCAAAVEAALPTQPPLAIDAESAALLQHYYLSRMPRIAHAFELPERLLATSMSYFKRFWLTRGIAEPLQGHRGAKPPVRGAKGVKTVMLISLYMATKTHSVAIPLPHFASRVAGGGGDGGGGSNNVSSDTAAKENECLIRDYELEVASVLGWRFRLVHAFEGVRGISLELQRFESKLATAAFADQWTRPLKLACAHLRLTEAEFLYTPSQCALGVWWAVATGATEGEAGEHAIQSQDARLIRSALERWIADKVDRAKGPAASASGSSAEVSPTAVAAVAAAAAQSQQGTHQAAKMPAPASMDAEQIKAIAEKVSVLVRKGKEREELMASPVTLARVREVDAVLKEWTMQRELLDKKLAFQEQEETLPTVTGKRSGAESSTEDATAAADRQESSAKRAKVKTVQHDSEDE